MKIVRIVAASLAVLMFSSIGSLAPQASAQSSILSSLVSGSSSGQAAGAAVKAMYSEYKTTGKIDLTSPTNLLNITKLTTGIQGLKGKSARSTFYKDFAKGLVVGSESLIPTTKSTEATSTLSNLANKLNFGAILNTDAPKEQKQESQEQVVSTVTNLFKLLQ